jgi:hypothetical protein
MMTTTCDNPGGFKKAEISGRRPGFDLDTAAQQRKIALRETVPPTGKTTT